MKKVKVYLLSALVGAALLQGCGTKDVVAPTVTNANPFPNGLIQNKVIYTVHVISSSVVANAREEGLAGAEVTVSQNGQTTSKTVNEDGIAIFDNLYEGEVSVFIKSAGYASINQKVTLSGTISTVGDGNSNGDSGNNSNQTVTKSQVSLITLPKMNGALKGRFIIDSDKDPKTSPVAASGLKVRLTYPAAIEPNVYYTTANSDGTFIFTSVPGYVSQYAPSLSVDSSYSIGTGVDTTQYFSISFDSQSAPAITPLPSTGGSIYDLGNLLLSTGSGERVKFNGSVKGLLYGDYNFLNKLSVLANTALGGSNPIDSYTLGLAGINTVVGSLLISGTNGVFAPWITAADLSQTTSVGVTLIGNTVALAGGLSGDVVSESTIGGTNFATGILIQGVGIVSGTNTIVGVVARDLSSGVSTTFAGSNIPLSFFSSVEGFSAVDIAKKNAVGNKTAVSYITTNGSFVAASALPSVTNFITSGIKVKLTLTSTIDGYQGTQEFIADYDATTGIFSTSKLPVPTDGTANYDIKATVTKTYTRPDGYSQLVEFIYTGSATAEDGVIKDQGPLELTY